MKSRLVHRISKASSHTKKNIEMQAEAGTESALGIHNAPSNGPAVVPTPSQGPEQVQKTVEDSELVSNKMSIQPSRLTRSNANRSLFPNDKGSNESLKFITSHTLRNNAASKKKINLEGVLAS
ncbi:unnamed protein product [Miscanthus lutarioriparius]|uniref:Uncharacterized protein n=1 Tax=Miscanthus lutarioriparius TaxID=422564 RepID=A0A811N7S6_9POAL|nr:unnamed protein product [Miscanthus lutarioriparius]